MMDDTTKPVFEFDPLPGEPAPPPAAPAASQPPSAEPKEAKKRGRKPKAAKPERKKRGPRGTKPRTDQIAQVAEIITNTARAGEAPAARTRKKRRVKAEAPEFAVIQMLMPLSKKQRERVMSALNKVFG